MIKFIIRRIIQAIPTLIGISLIAYFIMWAAPGSPATALTFDPNLTARQRDAFREVLGLNAPFLQQYLTWMIGDAPIKIGADDCDGPDDVVEQGAASTCVVSEGFTLWPGYQKPQIDRRGNITSYEDGDSYGILRGDFGTSFLSKKPALQIIFGKPGEGPIWASLELGMISLLIGIAIGMAVGVIAAVTQGSWFDQVTRILAVIISAIPVFWLGLILLLIFGSALNWVPMGGRFPPTISGEYTLTERLLHLVLPVVTLSSFSVAGFSRFMRASMLDVIHSDYVRTAQAKGLSGSVVWFKHALRNALIPIATILGPSLTLVIGGAVLTETIYSWPGIGRLLIDAVRASDYPIIMAITMLLAVATVLGFILSDILYAVFDPRIRLS